MSFENEQYVSNMIDKIEAFEQEVTRLKKQLAEAVKTIEYLYPNIDKMFKDIPEGLSPMFYHTLSYDGDMKVRERLDNIANFLVRYRGNRE